MTNPIPPALSPEEWDVLHCSRDGKRLWLGLDRLGVGIGPEATVPEGPATHALAALALHGQSYGFIQEDVEAVREAAKKWIVGGIGYDTVPFRNTLLDLANRIEALLPPKP